MILCKAVDKFQDQRGNTRYTLQDNSGQQVMMKTEAIKEGIHNGSLRVYNLKLTSDNKLIHNPVGDRYGTNVTPQQFFSGTEHGIMVECNNTNTAVRITNNQNKRVYLFKIEVCDTRDNSGNIIRVLRLHQCTESNPYVMCDPSGKRPLTFDFNICSLGSFEAGLLKIKQADSSKTCAIPNRVKDKVASTPVADSADHKAEEEKFIDFLHLYWRRGSLTDDYNHGCSEDAEKAYHELEHLKSLVNKYGTPRKVTKNQVIYIVSDKTGIRLPYRVDIPDYVSAVNAPEGLTAEQKEHRCFRRFIDEYRKKSVYERDLNSLDVSESQDAYYSLQYLEELTAKYGEPRKIEKDGVMYYRSDKTGQCIPYCVLRNIRCR